MPDPTIDISTFGGALRHGYRITGYCPACSRSADLDLARYPPDQVYVGRRFRCEVCRGEASITVSQIEIGGADHAALERWRGR